MKPQTLAVLVIDMQPGFLKDLDADVVQELVNGQLAVLALCTERGIPVWKIELNVPQRGATIPQIADAIAQTNAHHLVKKTNSAFELYRSGSLLEQLHKAGIETLFLMGVNADGCVYETADDACHLAFEVVTHTSVIATSSDLLHLALRALVEKGCRICPFELLLDERARDE